MRPVACLCSCSFARKGPSVAEYRYNFAPEGPITARIAVVCEKPANDEIRLGRILVGSSGSRVRRHLARAGLNAGSDRELSKEVFLTNAVQSFDVVGNPTDADIYREIPRLYRELSSLPRLNVIIGMGAVALKSLMAFRYSDISNRRGSRLLSKCGTKYIPTFHPAFYMRGEWRYESVVQFDVQRAVEESQWPEIRKTPRFWNIRPTLPEAIDWMKHLKNHTSPYLSFDIETFQAASGTWYMSCISFSADPTEAFCIPLTRRDRKPYWQDISTESLIWRGIADLLNQPNKKYVTQNGTFDCGQLRKHGVLTPYMATGFDTYSAHSLLAPDLPHDLGFIVSIYTDEEYYKDESGRGQAGFGNVSEDKFWIYGCKDAAITLEAAINMTKDMKEL